MANHLWAGTLTFPNYPISMSGLPPAPNVLILYDNSFSMEGQLSPNYYTFIGGNDPKSRSNIARTALRSIITSYRSQFNWGIGTFEIYGSKWNMDGNGRSGVYTGYEGDSSTMVFTNDCVNGISWSNGGLKCIPNPEPNNGYSYITYNSGSVGNSSFLLASYYKQWSWGTYAVNNNSGYWINIFDHHNSVTTWNVGNDNSTSFNQFNDFKDPTAGPGTNYFNWTGCLDTNSGNCVGQKQSRIVFMNDGWVFMKEHTGNGAIIEPIMPDATSGHTNNLLKAFAPEVCDLNTPEIKNGSLETPLVGSFITAKKYFSGTLPGFTSPIQNVCQKNFVLLATDGQPTADANGNIYSAAQLANANTGKAYTDLYSQIQALRSLSFSSNTYDIQTYVLGMGDFAANSVAMAGLNNMAQYGGTNQALLAQDPTTMMNSFQSIVDQIQYKISIRTNNGHIAISQPLHAQTVSVYKAFYGAQGNMWGGNLIKATPTASVTNNIISYNTGTTNSFTNGAAQWLTSDQINGRPRQIITATRKDSPALSGAAFSWDTIGTYTQNLLLNTGETAAQGMQRINYIRGNRSNENNVSGFRTRLTTVLGDIINSSPVYVGVSTAGYSASDFPLGTPSFTTYVNNTTLRRPMVYIGANDGMLHGFDADTLQEVFAYIPNAVIPKLTNFSSPSYTHDFFVDETPLIADVPLSNNWTTQLIGFPGIGGTGLFALNITNPDTTLLQAENNANTIVLWELNGQTDADIGYILNRGQVNQIRGGLSRQVGRMANNRWAVITGNGYNSANNSTGLVISYLDASGGTPSYKKIMIAGETGGLSTPTPIDINNDGLIDYAYAGDLKGNVWRFDLRGDENTWSAFKLYVPNADWALSPITTAPTITYHCSQPGLMVIVGTGKYLEVGDNNAGYTDSHTDYMMGLWDKFDTTSITHNSLAQQWYYASGDVRNVSSNAPDIAQSLILTSDNPVDWATQRGWFLPLFNNPPRPARVLVPPYVANNIVYFNTTTPDFSVCENGKLWATTQALNACTGGRPQLTIFDINFDGKVNDDDKYDQWGNGNKINVTGVNLQNQARVYDASVWISPKQFTCTTPPCDFSTGLSDSIGVNLFQTVPKRLSWKELNNF
ncbi:MAG: PilC/PilY family type IV pilus protein [Pseudomonadota bacterium]